LKPEKRYWESSVIIAYLNDEHGRAPKCKAILDAAEEGKIQLFTSALTIAEVLRYRGSKPIGKDKKEKVFEFFENDYITIINLDRWVARLAQEVVWDHNVPPKDAIHVASALKAKLTILETYDGDDLIKRSKNDGFPKIDVREPTDIQLGLFDGKEKEPEEEPEEDEK
jgi:predicted nucleic acid-binding protein